MSGRIFLTLLAIIFVGTANSSTRSRDYYGINWQQENGDSIMVISLTPVPVFKRKADLRRYYKLVYNLKKVYPIAKFAKEKFAETELLLAQTTDKKEQRKIVKQLEKQLIAEYTPVLKKMTFSQGKILLKLIDRETGYSSYEILKDLKGGFTAGFWQAVAKLFSSDLKETYDKEGEDRMIEQIIKYYEAGLI